MANQSEVFERELEGAVPAVWRRPAREVPLAFTAMSDLMDGTISTDFRARLEQHLRYERVAPIDPERELVGTDPLVILIEEDEALERLRRSLEVRRCLRALPAREATALRLRFGISTRPHTQDEAARVLGISRRALHNVERRALAALGEVLANAVAATHERTVGS